MITFQKFLTSSTLYALSNFLIFGGGFLLLPIYTHFLSPEDYGIFGIITSLCGFLSVVFLYGSYNAQYRFYIELKTDTKQLGIYLFTLNSIILFVDFIIGLLVYFSPIGVILFNFFLKKYNPPYNLYMVLILLITTLLLLSLFAEHFFIADQRYILVSIIDLGRFIVKTIISIYLLVVINIGVMGLFEGIIFSSLLIDVPFYLFYAKRFHLGFDRDLFYQSLKIGLPIMINAIISSLTASASILIVQIFLPPEYIGIYSLTYTIALLLSIITIAYMNTWITPFNELMQKRESNDENIRLTIRKAFYGFILLLCGLCLFIQLFSKDLVVLVANPRFYQTITILPIMITGFIGLGINQFFVNFYVFYKKTFWIPVINIVGLTIFLLLNFTLTPTFGLIGTAFFFTITQFILAGLTYLISEKLFFNLKLNYFRVLIILMFVVNPIMYFLAIENGLVFFILKILYLAIFLLTIIIIYRKMLLELTTQFYKRLFLSKI